MESFQAVVWHALVSHPELAARQGHWESLAAGQADPVSGARAAFVDRDGTINELVPIRGPGGRSRRCASRTWR